MTGAVDIAFTSTPDLVDAAHALLAQARQVKTDHPEWSIGGAPTHVLGASLQVLVYAACEEGTQGDGQGLLDVSRSVSMLIAALTRDLDGAPQLQQALYRLVADALSILREDIRSLDAEGSA